MKHRALNSYVIRKSTVPKTGINESTQQFQEHKTTRTWMCIYTYSFNGSEKRIKEICESEFGWQVLYISSV